MKYHKEKMFRLLTSGAVLCFFIVSSLVSPVAGAGGPDGKGYFRQGRQDLEAGRYADAVLNFSLAQGDFSLLGDYTLYYLAEAFHGLGQYSKSLDAAQSLLKNYPATPLRKKARMAEIREEKEIRSRDMPALHEAYIKEYPGDEEALFLFGKLLKDAGNIAKASAVCKKVYIDAGELIRTLLLQSWGMKTYRLLLRSGTAGNLVQLCSTDNDPLVVASWAPSPGHEVGNKRVAWGGANAGGIVYIGKQDGLFTFDITGNSWPVLPFGLDLSYSGGTASRAT